MHFSPCRLNNISTKSTQTHTPKNSFFISCCWCRCFLFGQRICERLFQKKNRTHCLWSLRMRVRARADDTDSWNLLTEKCVTVIYIEEKKRPKNNRCVQFYWNSTNIFRPREFFVVGAAAVPFYLLLVGEWMYTELENSMTPKIKMNENSSISIICATTFEWKKERIEWKRDRERRCVK